MARKKGSKNYQRQGNKIINQFGVSFTSQEQKNLVRLVKKNNAKRTSIIQKIEPHQPTSYLRQAKPIIFAPRKTTSSLQNFRSKDEYTKYFNMLSKNTSNNFLSNRINTYKKNYKNALKDAFGRSSSKIRHKIENLTNDEFQLLIVENPNENISYIYSPYETGQLDRINKLIDAVKGRTI